MTCKYCGNELREDAKFCPHCGRVNGSEPEPAPSGARPVPAWEGPEGGGTKKRTGLIVGAALAAVAVAAVAVAVLLVIVVSGMFASPKGQVEKAAIKSAAAYIQANKALGLPELDGLVKDRAWRQEIALTLNSVNGVFLGVDASALSGLGLRLGGELDANARAMDLEMSAFWEDEELISFLASARDAQMYFSSPQLTGTAYGVNTETMGADLAEMTGDSSAKDISFNLFDWMDKALDAMDPEETDRAVKEANKVLWEAARVEKKGAKTLSVNGTSTKTALYRVTVPQEALEDYVDALAELMSSVNYFDLYEEMARSMGMAQDELDSFLAELEAMDVYGRAAEAVKDALAELGDLELDLCLSGGYLSAVLYQDEVNGSDVELALYLGGGEEYVDDLGLELEIDGGKLRVASSGDHGLKGGSFTDKTTLRTAMATVTSELQYDPKDGGFSWEIASPGAGSLDMTGSLTAPGGNSLLLKVDNASVKVVGLEVCSLGLEYALGPAQGPVSLSGDAKIITQMNELELMQMVLDTQKRTMEWSNEMEALFAARLPEELLDALMR